MNCKIGLIPLFFPDQDSNYEKRRANGEFSDHIEGRSSNWAFQNLHSNLDRNYALFMITPALDSFSNSKPHYEIRQNVQLQTLLKECLAGNSCSLHASAWIKVDKIWGDKDNTFLQLIVRIVRIGREPETLLKDLDPFMNERWQYAAIAADNVQNVGAILSIEIAVKLMANRGAIYIDDTYLSMHQNWIVHGS